MFVQSAPEPNFDRLPNHGSSATRFSQFRRPSAASARATKVVGEPPLDVQQRTPLRVDGPPERNYGEQMTKVSRAEYVRVHGGG